MVYVPKEMKKTEVPEEKLFCKTDAIPWPIIAYAAMFKAGKTSICLVETNTKVNGKYYCNVLLKKMIPEMNRLPKQRKFIQARQS